MAMNFNRKQGSKSNSKVTENVYSFPEAKRNARVGAHKGGEKRSEESAGSASESAPQTYPSGMFPSLGVAYPEGENYSAADIISAAYNSEEDLPPYSSAGYNDSGFALPHEESPLQEYNSEETGLNGGYFDVPLGESIRSEREFYPIAGHDEALIRSGEQEMTSRNFTKDDGKQESGVRHEQHGDRNMGARQDGFFSAYDIHDGVNGDNALQPAQFDISDYDYSPYPNEAGEGGYGEEAAMRNQREEGRYPAENTDAGGIYDRQYYEKNDRADQNSHYQGENYSGDGYADYPDNNAQNDGYGEFAYENGNNNAGGTPPYDDSRNYIQQNESCGSNDAGQWEQTQQSGDYRGETNAENIQQHSFPQEDNDYYRYNYPPASGSDSMQRGNYSDNNFNYDSAERPYRSQEEYAPPFLEYEEENRGIADDFSHINRDMAAINAEAGFFGDNTEINDRFSRKRVNEGGAERAQAAASADYNSSFNVKNQESEQSVRRGKGQASVADKRQNLSAEAVYDEGVYDWSAPPAAADAAEEKYKHLSETQRKGKPKNILFLAVFSAMTVAGLALYGFFGHYSSVYDGEPLIIRKDAKSYKVKAADSLKNGDNVQEQSLYDGMGSNSAEQSSQKALRDDTEEPLEKMEDRLPFSQEGSFDQSSVEALIKSALAQAMPIHIVPSVRVDADRKILAAAGAGDMETVLQPGAAVASAEMMSHSVKGFNVGNATAPPASGTADQAGIMGLNGRENQNSFSASLRNIQISGSDSGFYMQISSQPTKEAAEQSMRAAKKYLSDDIARKMLIVSAVIPDKGTYYRVRVPAANRDEAVRLCEDYKQAGGNCFVAR